MARILPLCVLVAAMTAAVGCQGLPQVGSHQPVTLRVTESSGTRPVYVTVKMDDQIIVGPNLRMRPGEVRDVTLNNPGPDAPTLHVGKHVVKFCIYKTPCISGDAEMDVLAGHESLYVASSEDTMPGWWRTGCYEFEIVPSPIKAVLEKRVEMDDGRIITEESRKTVSEE